VGEANAKEKAKAQKAIIRDCLTGNNGREKVENWVPRWMPFPPSAYTARGGINAVRRAQEIDGLFAPETPDGDPAAPQAAALVPAANDDPPFDLDPVKEGAEPAIAPVPAEAVPGLVPQPELEAA
jgi:ParB family chromosome partitioning protein